MPENELAIITLRHLTFGGASCPFKWGISSEKNCDLANELLKCKDCDPGTLHLAVKQEIPAREYLKGDVFFAIGHD
jgi:hypothetical protein